MVCFDYDTSLVGADHELQREMTQVNTLGWAVSLYISITLAYLTFLLLLIWEGVERQICTMRRVLAGLSREQLLTNEFLHTVMTMAEDIVNNRSLTPRSYSP